MADTKISALSDGSPLVGTDEMIIARSGSSFKVTGAAFVPVTYRKSTAKVVNTTVAETDLLNAQITVGANVLGSTGVLRGKVWGDWKQNGGSNGLSGPILRLKFGGTTQIRVDIASSMLSIQNSATRFGWEFDIVIANQNATNVQTIMLNGMFSYLSNSTTAAIAQPVQTGEGTHAAVNTQSAAALETIVVYAAGAIDTTSSRAIEFTTVNGSSSANYEVALQGALFTVH